MKTRCLLILAMVWSITVSAEGFREVSWDDLMPPGWYPEAPEVDHNLPFDQTAPREMAPIVEGLNKQNLRLPGYIVPIKFDQDAISEFLLVPYVGACIHVPPPPENQMVYVTLKEPIIMEDAWVPIWVEGTMTTEASLTQYATAGYRMSNATTKIYEY